MGDSPFSAGRPVGGKGKYYFIIFMPFLFLQERAIVHIHLMATAAFLFTIVIFMAGFAAFRGSMGAR